MKIKIIKLLQDDVFWARFTGFCYEYYFMKQLNKNRENGTIPSKKMFKIFIREYKILEGDDRSEEEIKIDLLSNIK